MKRHSLYLSVTLLFICISTAHSDYPPGWKLVFEDNFDTLDTNAWTLKDTAVPTNKSLQDYQSQQVTVSGGNLVITSEEATPLKPARDDLEYLSGQVFSTAGYLHGRFEIRADLPTTTGMWPAIWLLPDTTQVKWPSGGEIDIMENRGNIPHTTNCAFHYGTNPPYAHSFVYEEQAMKKFSRPIDFHSGMHTYAVEWEADQLRFYVDDVHYDTVHDSDVGGFLTTKVEPMNIVINTAIGGHFLDNPDDSTVLPQELLIDFVKVYQRRAAPEPVALRNGGLNDDGGSLAGWRMFGNEIGNVSVHNQAILDGPASLRLAGQSPEDGALNRSGVSQNITVSPGDEVEAEASAYVRSQDSIVGSDNRGQMKIEFYNKAHGQFGTSELISEEEITIADGSTAQDKWIPHALTATAPAGAVEARLVFVFAQPSSQTGAVHIDGVSFAVAGLDGDYNSDGMVDEADYTIWLKSLGQTGADLPADGNGDQKVDQADLQFWKDNFGSGKSSAATEDSVAEPAAL